MDEYSTHSIEPKFGERGIVELIDFCPDWNLPHFLIAFLLVSFLRGCICIGILDIHEVFLKHVEFIETAASLKSKALKIILDLF